MMMMMKKSVLNLVADDRYGVFADNEEAQFEMLLSLISDYDVNEEITTADEHGNHVRYLLLFLLIIIIDHDRDNHDSYLSLIIIGRRGRRNERMDISTNSDHFERIIDLNNQTISKRDHNLRVENKQ